MQQRNNSKSNGSSRRDLLKTAAGAGFWIAGRGAWAADGEKTTPVAPSEKLNVGFVGVAHRAENNLNEVSSLKNVNVLALCDIDDNYLVAPSKKFPSAKIYNDFRKMIDENQELDAIVVSTADHTHAIASITALKAGKHVYCEKPLTRTVYEARTVTETAIREKRVTQMGTQIHAGSNYRRTVELVQSGAIGAVREAHVFCDKSWGTTQPAKVKEEAPKNIHYDLWLGPTAYRPYSPAYLPANWRRYFPFGNGTLGDMGCHYMDLAFWALDLKYPTNVSAVGPELLTDNCPTSLAVHWDFPARGGKPPVKLSWYDGGRKPEAWNDWKLNPKWTNGVMFVGDKGLLFADYDQHKLLPEADFAGFEAPKKTIAESIGHHREWVQACLKNDPDATTCRFAYSGPLSETVLLGTVAYRIGKPLEWDAQNLKVTNAPEAEALIHPEYREGWTM